MSSQEKLLLEQIISFYNTSRKRLILVRKPKKKDKEKQYVEVKFKQKLIYMTKDLALKLVSERNKRLQEVSKTILKNEFDEETLFSKGVLARNLNNEFLYPVVGDNSEKESRKDHDSKVIIEIIEMILEAYQLCSIDFLQDLLFMEKQELLRVLNEMGLHARKAVFFKKYFIMRRKSHLRRSLHAYNERDIDEKKTIVFFSRGSFEAFIISDLLGLVTLPLYIVIHYEFIVSIQKVQGKEVHERFILHWRTSSISLSDIMTRIQNLNLEIKKIRNFEEIRRIKEQILEYGFIEDEGKQALVLDLEDSRTPKLPAMHEFIGSVYVFHHLLGNKMREKREIMSFFHEIGWVYQEIDLMNRIDTDCIDCMKDLIRMKWLGQEIITITEWGKKLACYEQKRRMRYENKKNVEKILSTFLSREQTKKSIKRLYEKSLIAFPLKTPENKFDFIFLLDSLNECENMQKIEQEVILAILKQGLPVHVNDLPRLTGLPLSHVLRVLGELTEVTWV